MSSSWSHYESCRDVCRKLEREREKRQRLVEQTIGWNMPDWCERLTFKERLKLKNREITIIIRRWSKASLDRGPHDIRSSSRSTSLEKVAPTSAIEFWAWATSVLSSRVGSVRLISRDDFQAQVQARENHQRTADDDDDVRPNILCVSVSNYLLIQFMREAFS